MSFGDYAKGLLGDENVKPKGLSGDAKLRAENPGLQELWDQYQTMLKLIKTSSVKNKGDSDTAGL